MPTRRISYSVQPETVTKLAALAHWQYRTASQQLDVIVADASSAYVATLSSQQYTQFCADLTKFEK
jgi:hypothetical protein